MIKRYLNIGFYMFSFMLIYYLLAYRAGNLILPYLLVLAVISMDIGVCAAEEYEKNIIMEKQRSAVYLNELNNQRENIEAIRQRNSETERVNHDLRKNLNIIKELLRREQYKEAQEYVRRLEKKCDEGFSYQIYANHAVINTLLNSKIEFCRLNNIDVKCLVCGRIDGVDDVELYCLLVNLLDNAITAAMSSAKPYISIFINCSDEDIYGEIINSVKSTECTSFEEMIPEKHEEGHGYGLMNIREIIRKNNGSIDYILLSRELLKAVFKINKKTC